MIITLICFSLIIIGIILLVISKKANNYYTEDNLRLIGWFLVALGIIFSFVAVMGITKNAVNCELEYQSVLHEKEMLEYRIEHMEENITGNEMLYNDIVEFNNELRSIKKWAGNPWTNWFNNQYIASIDYIELNNT